MSSNPTCVCCGQPMADSAYACVRCGITKPAEQLRQLSDMVLAARDVAHGLSRRGGGGAGGKPGSRLPIDLSATSKLDAVANALGTWVRHVAEERGAWPQPVPPGFDVIESSARFLAEHLEWWRHRAEVDEFLRDVQACARVVAGIAKGASPMVHLGPCGATIQPESDENASGVPTDTPEPYDCPGDIYAPQHWDEHREQWITAEAGRCRECRAKVSTAERHEWMRGEARRYSYTAAEISDAYPALKANTIRQWLSRGLLVAHGQHQGRPLLNLGEVLDLAAADAARREEARADRARRATAREAVEMGA